MSAKIRVGIVDYLNSKPPAWDFLCGRLDQRYEAVYRPPARVAEMLAAGEIDVGLIPTIEYQRIPGLRVLPSACVAARGAVRSVLLVSKVPFARIRRLALDHNSRTSVALVTILLKERYGAEPAAHSAAPRLEEMLRDADAALVIGDPALRIAAAGDGVLDLATAWREHTGLPFVFAFWAAHPHVVTPQLEADFGASLASGVAHLEEIADRTASQLDLDRRDLIAYLRHNLSFELAAEEIAGVEEFYRRAHRHGLIPAPRPLRLAGRESS